MMLRVVPVQRGNGAGTLLIGIRGPVVGIEREVRVCSLVDTHGRNGLRLACDVNRCGTPGALARIEP